MPSLMFIIIEINYSLQIIVTGKFSIAQPRLRRGHNNLRGHTYRFDTVCNSLCCLRCIQKVNKLFSFCLAPSSPISNCPFLRRLREPGFLEKWVSSGAAFEENTLGRGANMLTTFKSFRYSYIKRSLLGR
jgi:hypothetical protein